jgi:hypothetical protein
MERRDLLKFFPLAPLAFRDGKGIVVTEPPVLRADKECRKIEQEVASNG